MTRNYILFRHYVLPLALLVFVTGAMWGQQGRTFSPAEIEELTIWTGERIVFTKEDGADPSLERNQDRLTESVWISRRNDGGQVYNVLERDEPSKTGSPLGTLWAEGTTDQLGSLEFRPFRPAVGSPREVPGRDFVLFIEDEGIFVEVRFRSWSRQKNGGFSYERSTPAE